MNPAKVDRRNLRSTTDLHNIGTAMAADLKLLDIDLRKDLIDKDTLQLYRDLCQRKGACYDLCLLDVFISIVNFMHGGPARPWREATVMRRQMKLAMEGVGI